MYVATKGGEAAIAHAHRLQEQRGEPRSETDRIAPEQIIDQQWLAVSRVMTEGSVYDPELAALAIAQSQGDLVEAVFLLRAFRTTLPRFAVTSPIDTAGMRIERRISATFKDVPGGQVLGPTFDYSHRLINFDNRPNQSNQGEPPRTEAHETAPPVREHTPLLRVLDVLDREGLMEPTIDDSDNSGNSIATHRDSMQRGTGHLDDDLTREPLAFPAARPLRLQALARGDEGFLLGLAYSTQRGFGSTHPFVGEIRIGSVEVIITPDELDFPVVIGEIEVSECEMINQFQGTDLAPPQFTRG